MSDNVLAIQNYDSKLNDPGSRRYETYSYLQEMDAETLRAQIQGIIDKGWDLAVEHIEPARSNSTYWYMWKLPLFGEWKIDVIMDEINKCRTAYPDHHIKVIGYDKLAQTQGMAMIVHQAS